MKTWAPAAEIAAEIAFAFARLRPLAAQQPARQYAVRGHADSEFAAHRQNLRLDAARHQRVLDLQVADGRHRMSAANRLRTHFRQPDVPHITLLDQIGNGADGVLDRHRRVESRRTINVDIVCAEPAQRVRNKVANGGGTRVHPEESARRIALAAELHADDDVLALTAAQRIANQHFVGTHAVEVAGVEQRDAGVERGVDRGDAFVLVGRAVQVGHARAAEADRGNDRAGLAQLAGVHVCAPGNDFRRLHMGGHSPPSCAAHERHSARALADDKRAISDQFVRSPLTMKQQ